LVDSAVTRWYHCISRCVRRAFLLETDGLTNRKAWLQNRLQELCQLFSIAVAGFSILDNHLHVLAWLDPEVAKGWSAEEVARRWGQLFPPRKRRREKLPLTGEWIQAKVEDREWIAKTAFQSFFQQWIATPSDHGDAESEDAMCGWLSSAQ
jgi:REP element-mobilizing transposase RayT